RAATGGSLGDDRPRADPRLAPPPPRAGPDRQRGPIHSVHYFDGGHHPLHPLVGGNLHRDHGGHGPADRRRHPLRGPAGGKLPQRGGSGRGGGGGRHGGQSLAGDLEGLPARSGPVPHSRRDHHGHHPGGLLGHGRGRGGRRAGRPGHPVRVPAVPDGRDAGHRGGV